MLFEMGECQGRPGPDANSSCWRSRARLWGREEKLTLG